MVWTTLESGCSYRRGIPTPETAKYRALTYHANFLKGLVIPTLPAFVEILPLPSASRTFINSLNSSLEHVYLRIRRNEHAHTGKATKGSLNSIPKTSLDGWHSSCALWHPGTVSRYVFSSCHWPPRWPITSDKRIGPLLLSLKCSVIYLYNLISPKTACIYCGHTHTHTRVHEYNYSNRIKWWLWWHLLYRK